MAWFAGIRERLSASCGNVDVANRPPSMPAPPQRSVRGLTRGRVARAVQKVEDHHAHLHEDHEHTDLRHHEVAKIVGAAQHPKESMSDILARAGKKALGGGIPGAIAMGLQVGTLMWLRTTMNYQYRHGTTTTEALKKLYAEGGVRRFYRGVGPGLIQGPLSRFGDTAANAGMMALLDSSDSTRNLPSFAKTMCASTAAAAWRICLMPVDTVKTTMQVEGAAGFGNVVTKFRAGGPTVLYHGALAASAATWVGHFPWFATYNFLQENLPKVDGQWEKLGRNALIGFTSSVVSDTCSNSSACCPS